MAAIKRLLLVIMTILLVEKKTMSSLAQIPMQCFNYTELEEKPRSSSYKKIQTTLPTSLCSGASRPKNGWYRFQHSLNEVLELPHEFLNDILNSSKNIRCPHTAPLHPCREYDTLNSAVCFRGIGKNFGRAINITHCGAFYVYQLPQFLCKNGLSQFERWNVTGLPNTTCILRPQLGPTPFSFLPTTNVVDAVNKTNIETNNGVLSELEKEVNELDRIKNISEREKAARKIIDQLLNFTNLDKMNEEERGNGMKQQDLNDTVRILQKIIHSNISNGSLNILGPANNILDSRNTKSWRNMTNDKLIRDLVLTLEKYGFQYGENLKNNPKASANSAFQSYSTYANVQLHVRYIKQAGNLSMKDRLFKFPDASFNLSPDALPQESGAVVVVMWYKTIQSFLRNSFYGDNIYAEVKSEIITASVQPTPRVKFLIPVRISWNTTELNDSDTCVYWKPEWNENEWKTDGCVRVKDKSDSNRLICECDHLTAFAGMDISRDLVSKSERQALELISTIGCSISLFGIFLTILTHALLWKRLHQNKKRKVPSQVLMHLCVAIGMTDILAILAGPAQNNEIFCKSVSMLLYFFILVVFGWMLCEGIVIYLQLVSVYAGLGLGGRHMKYFYVIGWGIPTVVVTVLVGANGQDNFITKRACWCRGGGVLFWTFAATIGIILTINLVIFILALRSALFSSVVNRTAKATAATALRKAKVGLKGSAVLLPLLGLTWVFGLLVFNRDTIVFKYLFAICNSLQGVMIFVFHVLIDRKVREAISREKKARLKARHNHANDIVHSNDCATLSTSEGHSKSSIPVTPASLNNNTLAVQNHYTTENSAFNLDRNKDNRSSTADNVEYREVAKLQQILSTTN